VEKPAEAVDPLWIMCGGGEMKGIRVARYGGPEVLSFEEAPLPAVGPGDARVRVLAAGLNYIDVYNRTGLYPNPLPLTLGLEGAGTVAEVGREVRDLAPGDVVAWTAAPGSYAEEVVAPAAKLVKVPKGLDPKTAAALMLQGMTAHYLTHSTYPLKAGDTCLVHAAAGGVGLLLCQMAKMRGARVLGTVSTEEKGALARGAGADEVILYAEVDFLEEVRRLTGNRGVNVVYDSVGKTTFDKSLSCLAPRGLLALFGQSSGSVPPVDLSILGQRGSLFLTRPSLFHYTADRESLVERAGAVLSWAASGKLDVRIGATYPLRDAAEAHRALEGRKTTGKVVLLP
jgi:NADPH2:quinone reductase